MPSDYRDPPLASLPEGTVVAYYVYADLPVPEHLAYPHHQTISDETWAALMQHYMGLLPESVRATITGYEYDDEAGYVSGVYYLPVAWYEAATAEAAMRLGYALDQVLPVSTAPDMRSVLGEHGHNACAYGPNYVLPDGKFGTAAEFGQVYPRSEWGRGGVR